MPPDVFSKRLAFRRDLKGALLDAETNKMIAINETDLIRRTFRADLPFRMWRKCCDEAVDCCRKNSIYLPATKDSQGRLVDDQSRRDVCPATWDGYACWPESPAGLVARLDCPSHLYFYEFRPHCVEAVTKQCFVNGSWFVRNGHEWSNYGRCGGLEVSCSSALHGGGGNPLFPPSPIWLSGHKLELP